MAELARASSGFAARRACPGAACATGALIALLGAATPDGVALAQPRVEVTVTPAGAQAEELGERVLELLATTAVRAELRNETADASQRLPDAPLARVSIDLAASTHVRIRIRAADGAELTRELPREQPELDEAAREEAAAVVASSIDALLAGELPAAHEATDSEPATPTAEGARGPEPDDSPAAAPRAITADTHLRVAVGYEVGLWGEGTWLHGPQLVLGYAVASAVGRLGVRGEGFLAWTERAAGDPIDAEISAMAVRILASLEPPRRSAFGFELGAGLSAQLTTVEAANVPPRTQALDRSSSMGWALRLYGGVTLHEGLALFALGTALELDPVRTEYGVHHPDGFVTSHSRASVRPSVLASVGLGF